MNSFQDPLSNMDQISLIHTHPASAGRCSDGMQHQIPSPSTEAARFVGGHVDLPYRNSHESSTASASVFQVPTGYHPGADQDVPFNGHRADFRWSGVFGTTWNSKLGQGEPLNEDLVNQRWTGSLGPTDNLDLSQRLLPHDQTADQQWSGVFGNGWHLCLDVPMNERSAFLDDSLALQLFNHAVERT